MKWQLLHNACWAGDPAEVEQLLIEGADPNQLAPTDWRQRPLHRTLEFRRTHPKHKGHLAVIELLLAHGADPRLRATHLDMTAWELAVFGGFAEAELRLREYRSRGLPHPSGMTPLWLAAASRLPEEQPLGDCTQINGIWRRATPLMMAAAHAGNDRVAHRLLAAGSDPNAGTSLLHASCDWHFEHLVGGLRFLASRGWRVNEADAAGQMALHKAAFLGYSQAARTLLELGANRDTVDRRGARPIDVALAWRKTAVARLLA